MTRAWWNQASGGPVPARGLCQRTGSRGYEPEAVVLPLYAPVVRRGEVSGEKVSALVRQAGEQSPPGCHRLGRVVAAGQAEFRTLDLNRVVECVSGEIGPLAERFEPQQCVAGRVP